MEGYDDDRKAFVHDLITRLFGNEATMVPMFVVEAFAYRERSPRAMFRALKYLVRYESFEFERAEALVKATNARTAHSKQNDYEALAMLEEWLDETRQIRA